MEKPLTDRLKSACEALNTEIVRAEKALAALRYGVEAWVPVGSDDFLGWAHASDGGWRPMYRRSDDRRLTTCSVAVRIACVPFLGALREATVATAETRTIDVPSAATATAAFADSLGEDAEESDR